MELLPSETKFEQMTSKSSYRILFPDHGRNMLNYLNKQRKQHQYCDLIIQTCDTTFHLHQCVMTTFSQIIKQLLDDNPYFVKHRLKLDKLSTVGFRVILNYIYSGKVEISSETASETLEAAKYLMIPEVVQACSMFMEDVDSMQVDADIAVGSDADIVQNIDNCSSDCIEILESPRDLLKLEKKITKEDSKEIINNYDHNSLPVLSEDGNTSLPVHSEEDHISHKYFVSSEKGILGKPQSERKTRKGNENNRRYEIDEDYICKTESSEDDVMVDSEKEGVTCDEQINLRPRCNRITRKANQHNRNYFDEDYVYESETSEDDDTTDSEKDDVSDSEEGIHKSPQGKRKTHEVNQKSTKYCVTGNYILEPDENHTSQKRVCSVCNQSFLTKEYKLHVETHRGDPRVYACDKCNKIYMRKFCLTNHIAIKHSNTRTKDKYSLLCKQCNTSLLSVKHYIKHMKEVHNIAKGFQCKFPGCAFRGRKPWGVIKHAEQVHSSTKHLCSKCGKVLKSVACLEAHKRACFAMRSFLCDICGKSFNHPGDLRVHHRSQHENKRTYICFSCGKDFSCHANLRRHNRIHDNVFPYKCSECDKAFRHSNSLKSHLLTHK